MNLLSRDYVESLYLDFKNNPSAFSNEWQEFFKEFEEGLAEDVTWSATPESPNENGTFPSPVPVSTKSSIDPSKLDISGVSESGQEKLRQQLDPHSVTGPQATPQMNVAIMQDRVDQLIRGFRVRGHLEAKLDPLNRERPTNTELHPEYYGLLPSDMQKRFSARTISGENVRSLEEIISLLQSTYCRSIGVQFMHIDNREIRDWLQQRMEGTQNRIALDRETQLRVLTRLTDAVTFEQFVRTKFKGAKTFSLEGAESLIPLLDMALEKAGDHDVEEVVLGMAHRGRLNVLANVMGKASENIFWSFDDPDPESNRSAGDVLYHLGYSCDWKTQAGKKVHISLCFNPSHLEFVNPVAIGRCRSKQDRIEDTNNEKIMTVLIHGDAAFAGEGVVQETLNMSQLAGYRVGGTLHVIINNQVGFTTTEEDGRSTTYASDVAKMLQIPIFHVNGEDPEAVAQVVSLAMEFRKKFRRDVVIDMYCYRRLGHNESDEPRFTQPLMYKAIEARPTVRDSYLQHLLRLGEVTQQEADEILAARKTKLQSDFDHAKNTEYHTDEQSMGGYWQIYYGGKVKDEEKFLDTGVEENELSGLIKKICDVPADFNVNPKLKRLLQLRSEMSTGKRPVDWAMAELAAYGSLAVEGHPVRLSGQDCGRGTFSHRQAVLTDTETGERYLSLKHLKEGQAEVDIINSPLSEAGVVGFEYGYSLDTPEGLTLWEAQFGDFSNVAQVIIDQFITSAEDKWRRLNGLVMLLPHGFEGAGPEHCSARLERYLMLTAEDNIQIVYPTSAAQYFHLLRRQVKRNWRKPLIVLTPKSLLRDPMVASPLEDLTSGYFKNVLPDPSVGPKQKPRRVLLTTGKIGVELIKLRDKREQTDVSIIRLEQLYPLPMEELQEIMKDYDDNVEVFWVQEEPMNMGSWQFIFMRLGVNLLGRWPLKVISRPESASPATGSKNAHKLEQEELMDTALGN